MLGNSQYRGGTNSKGKTLLKKEGEIYDPGWNENMTLLGDKYACTGIKTGISTCISNQLCQMLNESV